MTIQPYKPQLPEYLNGHVAKDSLTQGEYEAFKAALPSWRDRLIAMLLRNTGIRINELLNLEIRHCAFEGPAFIIYIQRSKKRESTEFEPIYINPGLGVQLRDYIKGNDYKPMERLFGNRSNERDSRKITARGLRFVFEKTGLAALGRKISPRDFRSFFVQTMVDGGVPLAMASKMVGHESEKTTQAHYYKLSVDRVGVSGLLKVGEALFG